MKNVQKIDLGLTGYDELFANDEERKVNKLPRIFDIPISEIDDFPDHPFKVKIDEDMDQLVQSIKERGIITPVTLRPKEDGRYTGVGQHKLSELSDDPECEFVFWVGKKRMFKREKLVDYLSKAYSI